MNTIQILGMCKEIYRDLTGNRTYKDTDKYIYDLLIRLYNTTEIDWEEVKSLWIEYLTKGSLSFPEAFKQAKQRTA